MISLLPVVCFAADKVVLQLKWEHEFQFAGFYAADWQGFYQQAGIEVEIRSISSAEGKVVDPMQEIMQGRADFAIGAMDILQGKDRGAELVMLFPIFQRSPSAVFSLKSQPIESIAELSKLRIAAKNGDATRIEVEALFKSQGYDLSQIQFVDVPININSLLNDQADAIVTYEPSAIVQAKEKQVQLNKLHPADFGMRFYGDTLYTSVKMVAQNRELVERFIKASKKGWQYALQNKTEIAKRISNELPRYMLRYQDPLEYNLTFAQSIDSLLDYPNLEIGSSNLNKWMVMHERIRELGVVKSSLNQDQFFYRTEVKQSYEYWDVILFITIILLTVLIFVFWYQQRLALTLSCLLALLFSINIQVESNIRQQIEQSEKIILLQQLNSLSAKLKGNLENNLSIIVGFAAYISATPDINEQQFNNYAEEVYRKATLLNNFAAAKDLIVNFVYPLEGNEKVIGLDYLENAAQRDLVIQVATTGQLLVAGPVELVQGGIAFIGRAPIFTDDGNSRKLWGIISAPLNADLLYSHSGIFDLQDKINLAIKSFDAVGQEGDVFFGNSSTFTNPLSIKQTISVGGGAWQIAAARKTERLFLPVNIFYSRLFFIIAGIASCLFVVFRFRSERERRKLQNIILANQNLLEKVGSVAKIGGFKLDQSFFFKQWSKQLSILLDKPTSYQPNQLNDLRYLFEPNDFSFLMHKVESALKTEIPFDIELKIRMKNQVEVWLRIIANVAHDRPDDLVLTGTIQDVTRNVKSAKLIEHQANYDSLTNLPNRILFNDRLNISIESALREKHQVAVIFIDLDRFKPVNDNHGHQIGDQLLIQTANRISQCIRKSDTVSRLSGDEFGVILNQVKSFEGVNSIAEKIKISLQETFIIDDVTIHCSASIGIAFYPDDAIDAESLIQKADQAMYEVKRSGRNGWHFYTQEMQLQSERRHKLLNDLIHAIDQEQLSVFYQPIIDLKSQRIAKCESLARWFNEEKSIAPAEFIELAEESGLINKIDLFMLKQSAKVIAQINQYCEQLDPKHAPVELSINVSPRLFQTKDRALEKWLQQVKESSQNIKLTIEITERLLTQESDKAFEVLGILKSYGVKVALDDFGTGYSSLNYLIKFPVDIIKIDRGFINGIGVDPVSETLIETIIAMAQRLNIEVIAEGIEEQKQLDFLNKRKCDFVQGYYFAKPMNANDFKQLIKKE